MSEPALPLPSTEEATRVSLRRTFAALRHRNYRLWFVGQLGSLLGSWMQITAQGFLMFELTRSSAYLGYVGFAAGVPAWLFTLYGGVVADRVSRQRLLLAAQLAMMLLAALLTLLSFLGVVRAWHLLALAFLGGVANAFDAPARQAFVAELVPREDLTNAIALNSTMFNTATALGPTLAGLAYAWIGPAPCFAVNTVSYLAVIGALLALRLEPSPQPPRGGSTWQELMHGLRFVAANLVILPLVVNLATVSVLGVAMMTLMPAWAVNVLGGGARTNGLLLSARGVGALSGSLTVAALGSSLHRGRLLTLDTFLLPALMLVFSSIRSTPLALGVLCAGGWALISMFNTSNALVQAHTPDELRGRVMGIYVLTFFGLMPLGALLYGSSAARFGEPAVVACGALLQLLAAALLAWLRPSLRKLV